VSATTGLKNEAAKMSPAADDSGSVIPDWVSLDVAKVAHDEPKKGKAPSWVVHLEDLQKTKSKKPRSLTLFQGYSADTSLGLSGAYTLLVHEILGDMAGTECAARVVHDIKKRGLCSSNCQFIPHAASTMIAPTAKADLSLQEKCLHRLGHRGKGDLEPLHRYAVRFFPLSALLADPQPLEVLDFGGDLQLKQTRDLEFRTTRDAEFDGIHMHLLADVDETAKIDVLRLHNGIAEDGTRREVTSSWNTTYVKLYATPLPLPKGSRINLHCVADLAGEKARYVIKASVGEKGKETNHVEYSFEGC
jgi:hypothetical protein